MGSAPETNAGHWEITHRPVNEFDVRALLDAHDALVASWANGSPASSRSTDDELPDFMEIVIGRRLREVVARYPDFQAAPEMREGGAPGSISPVLV
jgi:hypothetical protein